MVLSKHSAVVEIETPPVANVLDVHPSPFDNGLVDSDSILWKVNGEDPPLIE